MKDQIYNADKMGLNLKILPAKSIFGKQERKAPGYKKSKERVTIFLCCNCCNISGYHCIPLTLTGKYINPQAIKHKSNCTAAVLQDPEKQMDVI